MGVVSELADVISGYAFKSSWFGKGESKVIRIGDLKNRCVDIENCAVFDETKHSVRAQFTIKAGDILMALSGATVGKIAIATKEVEGSYLNQRVAIIRGRTPESARYLKYVFFGNYLDKLLLSAGGAAQPNLSPKDLANMEVPFPPQEEQIRIAAILDKADAIRRKRLQAIRIANDFLRSVFLDMFGDPVSNRKRWNVKKLSEISTKILNGTTPKGGSKVYVEKGVNFLRSQNVWKNNIVFDDLVYLDEPTHIAMAKSSLKTKDILMTKTGRINTENSSLGRAAIFYGADGSANINGHVYLIRLKDKEIHEFIVFILTMTEYRDYIRSVCVGGIDKRQINKNHLEDFPIIYPPKEAQQQFVKTANLVRSMLEKSKAESIEAEKMFNSLSQKAFNGQL